MQVLRIKQAFVGKEGLSSCVVSAKEQKMEGSVDFVEPLRGAASGFVWSSLRPCATTRT